MSILSDAEIRALSGKEPDEIFEGVIRRVAETMDQPTFTHVEMALDQLVEARVLTTEMRRKLLSHDLDTEGKVSVAFDAANVIEAGFVASALKNEGIPSYVEDRQVGDLFGGTIGFTKIRVWVAESDVMAAKEMIDELMLSSMHDGSIDFSDDYEDADLDG